ncbi:hypothetical protein CgunFtcFv8_020447 [Champsocephalus gunnari]|uniref:Uncharacterized protein n=1 Tax=Champsocephalus gunnari TaxID=52237 RepID=A0AAN8E7B0_CHAGU|nr:hypothetical protein CgunFtcFv8_020447 [Champsocephalus gunnari]
MNVNHKCIKRTCGERVEAITLSISWSVHSGSSKTPLSNTLDDHQLISYTGCHSFISLWEYFTRPSFGCVCHR